jgi:hypothetical protein
MISIKGNHFEDEFGRTLVLRGVNLGGSSKVPFTPNGATWNRDGFYDHQNVSFVGRPFPLDQADEHFSRLKAWGFTFIRYLVTWEAIEHAGPGIYDLEYLAYTRSVIRKAADYGIQVFIDPHQDVWSRFTGGDGAPGWVFEKVGMDLTKFHTTGAAFTHQENGDPYPRMIWPTNYSKLAAATMFTLFFAGNDFAPELVIDGQPVQEYLQSHYINAIKQVAGVVKDLPNVVGFDTLNEPSAGLIGQPSLYGRTINPLMRGAMPTFFQSMLLAAGYEQQIQAYRVGNFGFVKDGLRTLNPGHESIWLPGHEDIWKSRGLWAVQEDGVPVVKKDDYFARVNGRPVDFNRDYFKPFANRFAREIRSICPAAIIFLEEVPNERGLEWTAEDVGDVVCAGHWYDNLTLIKKTFVNWFTIDVNSMKLVFGKRGVRENFSSQIRTIIEHGLTKMNNIPTVIGEVGIPFDLNERKAYLSGDDSGQVDTLDATMYALESNFANFTLWNYTADNTNARGDQWNDEDLSLYSADQKKGTGDIHDGGRALRAAVRPYPMKIAGVPEKMNFDIRTRVFTFSYNGKVVGSPDTEIFVPAIQYPGGCQVKVSDGTFTLDAAEQILHYHADPAVDRHQVEIRPAAS